MARLRAMDETDDSPVVVDGKEYRTFECPSCGFPICEWTDCPECGWYNEDIWDVTEQYHGFGDELATDGSQPDEDDERGTTDVHGCATCSGYAYGDDDQCPECQQRDVSPVDETPL